MTYWKCVKTEIKKGRQGGRVVDPHHLDLRYIWDFIAFPVSIVLVEPKKPNLPLPSVGEIFLQPFEDELCPLPKKHKKFSQKWFTGLFLGRFKSRSALGDETDIF